MTPPPAGSWIRIRSVATGWTDIDWHLFTGDMTWRPTWFAPSLEAICGYATGSKAGVDAIEIAWDEPLSACPRCLARAARLHPAH